MRNRHLTGGLLLLVVVAFGLPNPTAVDAAPKGLTITQNRHGDVTINGTNGDDLVYVCSKSRDLPSFTVGDETYTFSGVRDVRINLRNGNDEVETCAAQRYTNPTNLRNLRISNGKGNSTLNLKSLKVSGGLNIRGGTGSDDVYLKHVDVEGRMTISTRNGHDTILIERGSSSYLNINSGSNFDTIEIQDGSYARSRIVGPVHDDTVTVRGAKLGRNPQIAATDKIVLSDIDRAGTTGTMRVTGNFKTLDWSDQHEADRFGIDIRNGARSDSTINLGFHLVPGDKVSGGGNINTDRLIACSTERGRVATHTFVSIDGFEPAVTCQGPPQITRFDISAPGSWCDERTVEYTISWEFENADHISYDYGVAYPLPASDPKQFDEQGSKTACLFPDETLFAYLWIDGELVPNTARYAYIPEAPQPEIISFTIEVDDEPRGCDLPWDPYGYGPELRYRISWEFANADGISIGWPHYDPGSTPTTGFYSECMEPGDNRSAQLWINGFKIDEFLTTTAPSVPIPALTSVWVDPDSVTEPGPLDDGYRCATVHWTAENATYVFFASAHHERSHFAASAGQGNVCLAEWEGSLHAGAGNEFYDRISGNISF